MADIFDKCFDWKEVQLAKLAGHYPYFRVIEENRGTEVVIGGKRLIMACSNNYLGLAQDPRVREAAADAARRWGSSTCGSALLNGTLSLHEELARRLARFLQREAVAIFTTGFTTNLGTIASLISRRDQVFTDRMVHASIVEGAHACYGEAKRFRHNNMEDLERQLAAAPAEAGKLIVVDSVYSMEGDLANLPGVVELKKKYAARLMVDEAHGFGVLGEHGRGGCEHFGVEDEVDIVMTTLSKSLASIGGVIAASAEVINWVKHSARPMIFQASMTPPAAAAALKSLEILEREPERRTRLWDISERVHRELRLMGFDTSPSVTPVVSIVVGDQGRAFVFWRKLTDAGLFVSPVRKPAVELPRVRAVFMATHEDEQIDRALEMFMRCGREVGLIPYEKPHTRVEVKMARPGATGFTSSGSERGEMVRPNEVRLGVANILLQGDEPLRERLSDAAEFFTWRALNADAEDFRKLAQLPERIWTQRHRVQSSLMAMGMNWVTRRQGSRGSSAREDNQRAGPQ